MRKLLVFPIVFAVFFVDICAFGATARGSRSIANAGQNNATSTKNTNSSTSSEGRAVAARAGVRANAKLSSNMVRTNLKAGMANAVSAGDPIMGVAARAAARPNVKMTSNMAKTNVKAGLAKNVSAGDPIMSARSATKQKAVNMGTKVSTAADNTLIPQECQDAFYGCMDSFCVLENVSGGRCRCDDRSEELDNVLDQIMKLDSQSQTLAEEGVERLQHGDAVDTIYSMAEQTANKVISDQKKNQKKFLDLESVTNKTKQSNLLGVFDTDELLGGLGDDILDSSDLADKKGNSLRSAVTKMCVSKVPSQCKEYSSMLQLVYAQKIKSDCIAYENDLKQRKMNSESLLKNAQKAIRDAAAEQYANKNKYKTVGECVVAFKQCMIGEEVCGSGFSKCVVDPTLLNDSSSKPYTIKTAKSITVEISASTYGSLEGNRGFCDSVLAQCVEANKNDAVWKEFLIAVAPELKAAEYNAEDESRRNCAQNILSCIKQQAAVEGYKEGSDSWYIFTSNPEYVRKSCGGELRKCNAYDGEMADTVMNFVRLSLNALRADRCTTTIKKCLQDSCGTDYSECLGFTVQDLQIYCPRDVIEVDCAGKEGDIYDYVNEVAQGVFLNADNALQKACLNAVNTAMTTYCNGTTSCSDAGLDYSGLISKYLNYQLYGGCSKDDKGVEKCYIKSSIHELSAADNLYCPKWVARLGYGMIARYIKNDVYNNIASDDPFTSTYKGDTKEGNGKLIDTAVSDVLNTLNNDYKSLIKSIETDPYVSKCMNGTSYSDFVGDVHSTTMDGEKTKFSNLTNNTRLIVARGIYDKFISQFNARVEELNEEIDAANDQINKMYADAKMECPGTVSSGSGSGNSNNTDSKSTGSSSGNSSSTNQSASNNNSSECKIGKCHKCTKAEDMCKCIAKTYFQHDEYETKDAVGKRSVYKARLFNSIAQYKDNRCYIPYAVYYEDGNTWKPVSSNYRQVSFPLSETSRITWYEECYERKKGTYADSITLNNSDGEHKIYFAECHLNGSNNIDRGQEDGMCGICLVKEKDDLSGRINAGVDPETGEKLYGTEIWVNFENKVQLDSGYEVSDTLIKD